jgi:hypothetical protein
LYFVSLFSDLMASGNPFQTVAMAARRGPDNFYTVSVRHIPRPLKTGCPICACFPWLKVPVINPISSFCNLRAFMVDVNR